MSFEVREDRGYAVVMLTGEVDLSCSAAAREAILRSLAARKPTLVDLSGVTYIDSSGVASLVEGYQTARRRQQEFGLIAVSEAVQSVLELAHLDRVFQIHASLEERLAGSAAPC